MSEDSLNQDSLPFLFAPAVISGDHVVEIGAEQTQNPERERESVDVESEYEVMGMFSRKDIASYLGALVYGYWENARAMAFDATGIGQNYEPGQFVRAQEGFQKLLDQNTGDGTIVALGFLGSEVLLKSIDKMGRKFGMKGFNPTIRFLGSVGFGIGLASWLETTKIMNNTVDIPGDLFGVGLGAAAILTTKIIAERATLDNFEKMLEFSGKVINNVQGRFQSFDKILWSIVDRQDGTGESVDSAVIALATRLENEIEKIDQTEAAEEI